ncbi:MAG: hypothetical protein EDM75_16470, partial [Chlorobiota bacterium]
MNTKIITLAIYLLAGAFSASNAQLLYSEDFENAGKWQINVSEGVLLSSHSDIGYAGNGLRFDINFTLGSGYGGVFDLISLELPENYQMTFYVKGEGLPANNFEFKVIDPSGDNVWWVNRKTFELPTEWTKITVRKRNLSFAWGPQGGGEIKKMGRLEFIVASFNGGQGSVWIDELKVEKLDPPVVSDAKPMVTVSPAHDPGASVALFDGNTETYFTGKAGLKEIDLLIDLQVQ